MFSQFLHAVEQGATVLTGSNRMCRSLTQSYTEYQRDQGRSLWTSPRIFSWSGYLNRCWRDWLLRSPEACPMLLNEAQEDCLWESIINESPEGRSLLRIPETARGASDAWKLLHAYRLPMHPGTYEASEDCRAFLGWTQTFAQRLAESHWLEAARLSDFVAGLFQQGRIEKPAAVLLAGFDELTPQQQQLLEALGATHEPHAPRQPVRPTLQALRDNAAEIRHAATWARRRLEQNPKARIGVIVPDLTSVRPQIERVFRDTLHPAAALDDGALSFHSSVGPPLSERPLIHAALLLLRIAGGPADLNQWSMLLRSPFLQMAHEERAARALLDAALRRAGNPSLNMRQVRQAADACPALERMLATLEREVKKAPAEQSPSAWSRTFSRLLKSAGWPGPRTLSSCEYQTSESWNGVLSTLATLDAVLGRIDYWTALSRLRKLSEVKPFQPENPGAPIEILGLLEASGVEFDHLWIMGLRDDNLPAPARPNPFLPISLQRKFNLPHCSAARELEFGGRLLDRLLSSAPAITISYPLWEGDQPMGPSPLLNGFLGEPPPIAALAENWCDRVRASAAFECLDDSQAPPIPIGAEQRGGTSMLRDMAACPFRAYAQHRLGARALEDLNVGIDKRDRGTAVHKALELIWNELQTQAALHALAPGEFEALLARSVDQALQEETCIGKSLERVRLLALLTDWFEKFERTRPPFRVVARENKQDSVVGGLTIQIRIDRVDELASGCHAIIDYKTSEVKSTWWEGERLDEPQVPLYSAHHESEVGAAVFAQLRRGDLKLLGIAAGGEVGPLNAMRLERGAALRDIIERWGQSLEKLATQFREGVAVVDPKRPSTCDYCDLPALCRVRDSRLSGDAGEMGEADDE